MNLEKFNKALKIFIIVLASILVVSIVAIIIVYGTDIKKEKPIKHNDCIKMGNFCTEKDIYDGVEVEIAVSKNKKQRFYVISNTEYNMTLMMNENIAPQVEWFNELFNIFGPETAMLELENRTKNWTSIDLIEDYTYNDNGYQTFINNCQNGTTNSYYDCSTELDPTRGYFGLSIKNGILTIRENRIGGEKAVTFNKRKFRARLATIEEIDALRYKKQLPKWLINDLDDKEGYWTMSSSTSKKTNNSQGAIAIANVEKQASIESLFVTKEYEAQYKIGIRPVITIAKEASEEQAIGH